MEPSTSSKPSQVAIRPAPDADISMARLNFFSLPCEIRILIYNQLLIQSDKLLRTLCTCKFCTQLKYPTTGTPTMGTECLTPSLLRTNRAIYDEALPILYSKNTFSFFCWGPFGCANSFSRYRNITRKVCHASQDSPCLNNVLGPIANRYSGWAGAARIIQCPYDAARLRVRRIFFKLSWMYHEILDHFSDVWWRLVESDVLRLFPGLDQIEIQLLADVSRPAIFLVFRRKGSMTARKRGSYDFMMEAASWSDLRPRASDNKHNIPVLVKAVSISHKQWEMKDCSFGLDVVRWTDDDLKPTGSKAFMHLGCGVHLGCR